MITVTTNIADVQRQLRQLSEQQFPQATKGIVNALAKEIWQREREEMQSVFTKPTPFILNGLRVNKWATASDPTAEVGLRSYQGNYDEQAKNALEHHIPGFSNLRARKRSEEWLTRAGYIKPWEYLVPSRTCPLDQYGNVRGSLMQKMLADIGAFRGAQGFDATTGDKKAKYVFGQVRGRNGRLVKGIWWVQGGRKNMARGRWKLMMLVVRKAPLYRKRFDFYGVANDYAARNLGRVANEYVLKALRNVR